MFQLAVLVSKQLTPMWEFLNIFNDAFVTPVQEVIYTRILVNN